MKIIGQDPYWLTDIPEEVAWEMSHDDWYFITPYAFPPILARKEITCNRCQCKGLMWVERNNRWTLAYKDGKLKGKLHACPIDS